ncbi:50S ribosomal protein L11 methyltransferase [Glaciecola siphonariae]|uniref:Ribosomal protein L11 methyltransferase n=1 Tax=Glaciecola siphonariae TaxID=521012 RepID=A0ABV9LR40_9ALTE
MPWQQIKINVKAADAEALGDILHDMQAQAVTFIDAKDTPVYEPKPGEVLLWPDTQVIGLYDADFDIQAVIDELASHSFFEEGFHYVLDQLEDKEWEREWMENFHPMKFGERLWICPSWRDAPDPSAVNVKLDPGLAFGTGTHPTTSLCLKWLDAQTLEQSTMVDFGCGSGILAVAALKLGAKRVIGIDIDPQALLASEQNAANNEVADKLELYLPQSQPSLQADVVMANILAAPLKELSSVITGFCRPGTSLVMSGILLSQVNEVLSKYEQNFAFDAVVSEGEWVRLVGHRK